MAIRQTFENANGTMDKGDRLTKGNNTDEILEFKDIIITPLQTTSQAVYHAPIIRFKSTYAIVELFINYTLVIESRCSNKV